MLSFAMPNSCAGTKESFRLGNTGELRGFKLGFHTRDVPRGTKSLNRKLWQFPQNVPRGTVENQFYLVPVSNTRLREFGTATGNCHFTSGKSARACST